MILCCTELTVWSRLTNTGSWLEESLESLSTAGALATKWNRRLLYTRRKIMWLKFQTKRKRIQNRFGNVFSFCSTHLRLCTISLNKIRIHSHTQLVFVNFTSTTCFGPLSGHHQVVITGRNFLSC